MGYLGMETGFVTFRIWQLSSCLRTTSEPHWISHFHELAFDAVGTIALNKDLDIPVLHTLVIDHKSLAIVRL